MSGYRNEDYLKSKDWLRFRKHWLKDNPPEGNGCYLCGICGRWILEDEVTLDHIEPRTADNIFDPDNIQAAHGYCNYLKGSRRVKPIRPENMEFLRFMRDLDDR